MSRFIVINIILFVSLWAGMDYFAVSSRITLIEVLAGFSVTTLMALIIRQVQRYYHAKNALNFANLSTVLICSAIASLIVYFIEFAVIKHDLLTNITLKAYLFRMLTYALMLTIVLLLFWIERQKVEGENIKKHLLIKQKEMSEFEIRNLEQQWQPHFLFNSLNSISALIQINPQEAQQMIHLLSDYMRHSIRIDQNDLTTLAEEIKHIQRYTNIEKIRFGERLNVSYLIDDSIAQSMIPTMTLQPLMENAIKYSLYDQLGNVDIKIDARRENGFLEVMISNPFDADTHEASKGTGFGLQSVRKKLYLIFKRNDLLNTSVKDNIFTVTMKIPQ